MEILFFVPNKIIGNNIEEKQFLQGKALCYSRGEYEEYLKFNEPLQKNWSITL